MKTIFIIFIALGFVVTDANASSLVPEIRSPYNFITKKIAGNFGRFNAHRQQQGVGLSWTMLSPQGIAGFVIERSYDNIYFEEISEVGCEASGRQRYYDNAVYPGYLYYRITAIMEDGSSEISETVMVRIVSRK